MCGINLKRTVNYAHLYFPSEHRQTINVAHTRTVIIDFRCVCYFSSFQIAHVFTYFVKKVYLSR